MSDLAAYLGAAVLVALAAYAFAIERRGVRRPIRWAALAFALSEGCSLALLAPGTVALSHAGVDGLSVIALGDTVRTAALSFLMLLACLLTPHPAPRHSPVRQATVAIAVQLGMVLLFVAAQPTLDADDKLIADPSGRWWLAVRVALFASYAVWALVELFLALLPSARTVPTGPLRWGVRLILAAVCVGVVWTLWSYDDFVRVLQVGRLDGSEDTVSNSLGALCATLAVAGALVGKWTETFGAAARWVRLCRCYFAMGPLWSALHQAMPEIAFPPGGRPLLVGRPAGIEFAVYRRVIEIHDGRLVLRAYQEAAVSDWLSSGSGSGSPSGSADAALAEAATIAIALENMRLGRRSAAGDGVAGEVSGEAGHDGSGPGSIGLIPTDLDSEVQWLSQVARAFRRSPVIPALLERLQQERLRQEADSDGRQLNRPA